MKAIVTIMKRVSVLVLLLLAANMAAQAQQYPEKWQTISKDKVNYKSAIVEREYNKGTDLTVLGRQLYEEACKGNRRNQLPGRGGDCRGRQ